MENRIFSLDNPKAAKAVRFGYLNAIHYMAPHKLAGVGNLCGDASPACIALCLGTTSGAAIYYPSVVQSRIVKARRFMRDRKAYLADIIHAIELAYAKANREGLKLCVRLNGSTDLAWEGLRYNGLSIPETFPDLQFVDYTKSKKRALAYVQGKLPANYSLTFSRSEINESASLEVLKAGGNVAVVFAHGLPALWHGFRVVNGDDHDLLHLRPKGVVIGLSPKGNKAKRDISSGFVVQHGDKASTTLFDRERFAA